MPGERAQKRSSLRGRIVARVRAATGPRSGAAPAAKGSRADQSPRTEVGESRTVQLSAARAAKRAKTRASRVRSRAVASSLQTPRIAQTAVFGTGVKPSPTPEPQSFQKLRPCVRASPRRARPICAKAQTRCRIGPSGTG